jgi:RNA polymerase sigma factor (sigma-70 family)
VHHELAYHEAEGSLARGELSVDDVVDAVLLQAYETFLKDRNAAGISRKHLVRLAINEIERAIKQSTFERKRTVPLERPLPKTPPNEYVSTLGEEITYFYTPDEALKVEDIIPDLEFPTPEEESEREELRACVYRALAEVPREWRRALLLRYIEEFDVAELATIMRKRESDIKSMLERARRELRQRLLEAGCHTKRVA